MNKFKNMLAIICIATTALLGACASPSNETTNENETVASNDAQFPLVIEHALGVTTIEKKPENVVTIGWGNLDVPLALGVAPVGVSKTTYGSADANGLFYWTNNAFKELGVDNPNVFDDTDGLDYEAIANANPDVILAVYSGITEEEYGQLSEIAPTVAYTKEAWATTWQDMTIDNGKALGLEEEAKEVVDETADLIAKKVEEHPELEGLTAAYVYFDTTNLGSFFVYMPKDPRASYLVDLGLTLPEEIKALDDGSFFFMTISAENVDVLNDLDLIVCWGEEDTLDVLQKDALMSQIPAVQRGSVVFLSNESTLISASCTPTPLSIKATIDEYMDLIVEASKKVN